MFRSFYQIHRVLKICTNCELKWRWSGVVKSARTLSLSSVNYRRKTSEEKEAEKAGRRVIRYTPKVGPDKVVGIWKNMTVRQVAEVLRKDTNHIYEALVFADKNSTKQYKEDTVIENQEIVRHIVKLSGLKFKIVPPPEEYQSGEEKNRDAVPAPPAAPEALRPRPPVVCVMGHVDHGKTTLLDALRNTSVVDQEFGGITQHIGAFSVRLPTGESVTFLDTPGHAAFAAMRSRGAHATDIVLLVVAADDGVMEQTVQSIRMAREANVPILVAVNKMDKPDVNPKGALSALAAHGVVAEELGGDVQAVAVSAKKRTNLGTLVEALSLQAQLMSLKSDPGGPVEGVVIEAELCPKKGKQATVLVRRGTLRRGTVLVAGGGWCRTRLLVGSDGPLEEAPPATPVRVAGWKEMPSAGDLVLEVESEKRANEVMKWRAQQRMRDKQAVDLEAVRAKEEEHQRVYRAYVERKRALGRFKLKREGPKEKEIKEDTHPALRLVVKGDVDGSVEAILNVLDTYEEHEVVRLDIVHFGVGPVSPSDLDLAEAFDALIYTFNLETTPQMEVEAANRGVGLRKHNVIYKMIDDVKEEINQRIPMRQVEEIVGEANVLQQFMITENRRKVCVAGCRCAKGQLSRDAFYKIIRGQEIIFEGKLSSMKHLKQEVDTIKKDVECGLRFDSSELQVQPGDTVVCYKMVDAPTTTAWDPGF